MFATFENDHSNTPQWAKTRFSEISPQLQNFQGNFDLQLPFEKKCWDILPHKCSPQTNGLFGPHRCWGTQSKGRFSGRSVVSALEASPSHVPVLSGEIPLACGRWWGCRDVNIWLSVQILPVSNEGIATLVGGLANGDFGRRVWSLSQSTFYEGEWVAIVVEEPIEPPPPIPLLSFT